MNSIGFLILFGAVVCMVSCDDNKVELCESEKDVACLRKYFKEHAKCSLVETPNPNPSYKTDLPLLLPTLNATVISQENYLANLDGQIEQAYLNKDTGNLLISINFPGLYITAPKCVFALNRDGEEPLVFTESVNCSYPPVLTAVIPAKDGITADSLKSATYSAYFPHSNANILLGPKLTESEDPQVTNLLVELAANMGRTLQEIFETKASYYFLAYLQNYICDFSLSPVIKELDWSVIKAADGVDTTKKSDRNEICAAYRNLEECARNYFEDKGSCAVVRVPTRSPVYRRKLHAGIPWLNLTAETTHAEISGLNGILKKMYINTKTNNLVMNIGFQGIKLNSNLGLIIYQRGSEPKVVHDHNSCTYPVSLTAIMSLDEEDPTKAVKNAYVSSHFAEPNAVIKLGQGVETSQDPQIQDIIYQVHNNPTTLAQEIFNEEGPSMFLAYLQNHICDYSIPLENVN